MDVSQVQVCPLRGNRGLLGSLGGLGMKSVLNHRLLDEGGWAHVQVCVGVE